MSTSVSPLSAGVQQLYDRGLLPVSLNNSILNGASSGELSQLANSAINSQENAAFFGYGSDNATLSSTASNALLQEINPSSTPTTGPDPLTQAVNNALTSNLDAAVSKFLPQSSSNSTGQINVLG